MRAMSVPKERPSVCEGSSGRTVLVPPLSVGVLLEKMPSDTENLAEKAIVVGSVTVHTETTIGVYRASLRLPL